MLADRNVIAEPLMVKSTPMACMRPLRYSDRLVTGAGGWLNVKLVLEPLARPVGVSLSTKTAFEPLALSVFTVAFKPLRLLVKLVTVVLSPPTVPFILVNEVELPVTVVVRLARFAVNVEMELVCPLTVVFKPVTVPVKPVSAVPFAVTVVLRLPTVEPSVANVLP